MNGDAKSANQRPFGRGRVVHPGRGEENLAPRTPHRRFDRSAALHWMVVQASFGLSEVIDEHCNLSSFPQAIFLLIRIATGEGWNAIMHEMRVQEPNCDNDKGDCGNEFAVVYIVSFILLVYFIIMNIIMAVVLDEFSLAQKEYTRLMSKDILACFQSSWTKYDLVGSGFIPAEHIFDVMMELPAPIGLSKHTWLPGMFLPLATKLQLPVYQVAFTSKAPSHRPSSPESHTPTSPTRESRLCSFGSLEAYDPTKPWPENLLPSEEITMETIDGSTVRVSVSVCVRFHDVLDAIASRVYISEVVSQDLLKLRKKVNSDFVVESKTARLNNRLRRLRERIFKMRARDRRADLTSE
ncbi:hypothetical protein CYMTET_26061, partial [Cymbomonas tetramitiformis]